MVKALGLAPSLEEDSTSSEVAWKYRDWAINWMGGESRLEQFTIRLRRPDLFGDTVWVGGKVVGTELTEEFGYAGLEPAARSQLSELVATGAARVRAALARVGRY